ncbi:spermidine/putrescine ABC transporter ATP-binding protein [Bacillus cereus group sp. MG4]
MSDGKTPPKNSAKVKKLGVGLTARKCPIGEG